MYGTACVVNVRHHGDHSNRGTCCGILLDTDLGLVLAHASCLGHFLDQGHLDLASPLTSGDLECFDCEVLLQRARGDGGGDGEKSQRGGRWGGARVQEVSTLTDEAGTSEARSRVSFRDGGGGGGDDISRALGEGSGTFLRAYSRLPARITHFFQCQPLAEALEDLMPGPSWELVDRKDKTELTIDRNNNNKNKTSKDSAVDSNRSAQLVEEEERSLLSSFVVLKLRRWVPYSSVLDLRPAAECRRGDAVEICSTPFGGLNPEAFMNSLSRGIVSNLAGKDSCLLLSDARCILGGEGSPLYTWRQGVEPAR